MQKDWSLLALLTQPHVPFFISLCDVSSGVRLHNADIGSSFLLPLILGYSDFTPGLSVTSHKMGRTVEGTHRELLHTRPGLKELTGSYFTQGRVHSNLGGNVCRYCTSKQCRFQHLSKPWRCLYAAAAASGDVKAARWLEFLRAVL